ncbi:molybdate ABC transporter permease subunit [Methanosarcina barkeri]|uniref:Molybdenum transport system permease protein ModB n=4 Tax=Methanosarcina TaxID=2207 RepID=A0A0E3QWS0_METBA|nr:Molybdenum transport system permease protein ModB [Methanosarcina barkeri MS]AKB56755.1 Molybdenum transport system permease protein ModB [Methanosarcina barkeri 227]AKJ37337.1 molybdate ABC transporter permease protein ModB1 [Methanosarcina barkeri CM1]
MIYMMDKIWFPVSKIWFPVSITFRIAAISSFLVLCSGVFLAYIFARRDFRGKELAELLVTLPLVLPPTVIGYLLVMLVGRNGLFGHFIYNFFGTGVMFTWQAGVIAAYTVSLPLMVRTAQAAIEAVDKELEYAAYVLGRSEIETAFLITLPLAKKGILAGLVLSFARAVGEFGATLMLAGNIPGKTNTMSLSIYSAFQAGNNELANLLVLILVFMSLLSIALTGKIASRGKLEV